ncbi:MAG: zinc transporter ZupT [Elusimicrobiota bacterium]
MTTQSVLFAFGLAILAGLSTGIGSAVAFFTRKTNMKVLAGGLGFSAGVMIYIALGDLLPEARDSLADVMGPFRGGALALGAFLAGVAVTALVDKLVPSFENPHEVHKVEEMGHRPKRLMRLGVFTALAMGVHNLPEGLATFVAALKEPTIGVSIALAIALHNIPEGISVSVPIYYATGNRSKAFWYSFLTGLVEPVGALLGFALLSCCPSPAFFGFVFAFVAGIMVFISFDELLPAAHEYGEHHVAVYALISGMAAMAGGLLLVHG